MSIAEPTREQAMARGLPTYKGRPCKHGHDGTRYVTSCDCVQCAKARRRSTSNVRRDREDWHP